MYNPNNDFNLELYIESFPFAFDTKRIKQCIEDNMDVFKGKDDFENKSKKLIQNFGYIITFDDGSYIDTRVY